MHWLAGPCPRLQAPKKKVSPLTREARVLLVVSLLLAGTDPHTLTADLQLPLTSTYH